MVSVSTTAKDGSRRADCLVWWFFFGLLKVLLGKPGTLHSPGHILSLGPGRPAGPKRRSRLLEIGQGPRQGGDVAAFPPIPRVGCAFSYQARVGPSPKAHEGPALNPFALLLSTYYLTHVPYAHFYATYWLSRMGQGERCRLARLVLALHPTGSHCAESSALCCLPLYRTGL